MSEKKSYLDEKTVVIARHKQQVQKHQAGSSAQETINPEGLWLETIKVVRIWLRSGDFFYDYFTCWGCQK